MPFFKKSVVRTLIFPIKYLLWNACCESRRGRSPSDLPIETSVKIQLRSKAKNAFVTNKRDVGIVGASSERGGGGETALEDHEPDFFGNL